MLFDMSAEDNLLQIESSFQIFRSQMVSETIGLPRIGSMYGKVRCEPARNHIQQQVALASRAIHGIRKEN